MSAALKRMTGLLYLTVRGFGEITEMPNLTGGLPYLANRRNEYCQSFFDTIPALFLRGESRNCFQENSAVMGKTPHLTLRLQIGRAGKHIEASCDGSVSL